MNERTGVLIAVMSSALGGGAAVATRFLIGGVDPLTLAAVRFGGGALCLLPLALLLRPKWPARADWPAVAGLGFLSMRCSSFSTIWRCPTRRWGAARSRSRPCR